MKLLTPTPEVHVYVVAILAASSLACTALTTLLRGWWPGGRPPPFLPLYAATLALVAGVGVVVLELPMLTEASSTGLLLSIPVGVAAGGFAAWCDTNIRRRIRRRARRTRRPTGFGLPAAASGPTLYGRGAATLSLFGLLVAVAVLEEALYRGVLVDLILGLSSLGAEATCLAGTVCVFALSHVYWGWGEVFAKLPLGAVALLTVLGLGTVLPAVLAHVFFNGWTWMLARRAP